MKFQSYSILSLTLSREINSNFIVYLMIHILLDNFQDKTVSSYMKTYPLVDIKCLVLDI